MIIYIKLRNSSVGKLLYFGGMKDLGFGVFDNFWNDGPKHLAFLGLTDIGDSLDILHDILTNHTHNEVADGLEHMLAHPDWRPHLVAAVAILKMPPAEQEPWMGVLWQRLKEGSWVSPQLLVVLSHIDPDFTEKAIHIVRNGFEVTYTDMSPVDHHVARGPRSSDVAGKKVVAAAAALLTGKAVPSSEDDNDGGGSIALFWNESLEVLIANGDITIVPR